MIDLPQHAAQIALLVDILAGQSIWADFFKINYATPYLTTYGLGWFLSQFFSVLTATKLILSLSFCCFVAMCVVLRRALGSDPRLDWLALGSYFGFAWKWGFLSFLLAAPIGLLLIWLSISYLQLKKLPHALFFIIAGVVLLISHGLIFIFAWFVSFCMSVRIANKSKDLIRSFWPVTALAGIFIGYTLIVAYVQYGLVSGAESYGVTIWMFNPIGRLKELFAYSFDNQASTYYYLVTFCLFLMPMLLGSKINKKSNLSSVLLVVTLLIFFLAPAYAVKTAFLYQRFAIFFLPAWALLFAVNQNKNQSKLKEKIILTFMAACVWLPLGTHTAEAIRFKRESADFEFILDRLAPQKRALYLALDNYSPADRHQNIYLHYGSWYQADKKGFVDFNFAWFPPQIMRFTSEKVTDIRPSFEFQPNTFDWTSHNGQRYDYFIFRSEVTVDTVRYFRGASCPPGLIARRGAWYAYEKLVCD